MACTVCYGGVLCGRGVCCVLVWCTVCWGGILGVRVVYRVLGRCNVWLGRGTVL